MTQAEIKNLDDMDLIDELNHTRDILDLCVHGVINAEYATTAEGLYWVKEDMNHLTKELQERFSANKRKEEPSNNEWIIENLFKSFRDSLKELRRTNPDRADAYLKRLLKPD